MAAITEVNVATPEPKVTMMEGFEMRRTHGSIQSTGTDDASSAGQMKFFQLGVQLMQYLQMVLRVYVPDQNVDITVFHGADHLIARKAPDTGYAGIASKEEAWSGITNTDL